MSVCKCHWKQATVTKISRIFTMSLVRETTESSLARMKLYTACENDTTSDTILCDTYRPLYATVAPINIEETCSGRQT